MAKMGMFDDIVIEDNSLEIRCVNQHLLTEFQTKGLDCSLSRYTIKNNEFIAPEISDDDNHTIPLTFCINIYTSCLQCHEELGLGNTCSWTECYLEVFRGKIMGIHGYKNG